MENRSLVTIAEHSKEKILYMLEMAKQFEMNPNRRLLQGKVVATLFFEPSTRTRLSFETAANRLGARVIGFTDPKATSSSKGETLKDTIMMVSSYADIIVMRHYLEGAARYASEVAPVPIVNAGDGANQHPSQTMLDLYSIYKTQGTLENLNIFLVGDFKYFISYLVKNAESTKRHCSFNVIYHISLAILQIKLLTGQFEIFRKGIYFGRIGSLYRKHFAGFSVILDIFKQLFLQQHNV